MKASVVILNWNGEDMLRRYLPSVIRFSSLADCEICVVDNASTDYSCDMVEREFPEVRLIRLDANYGFAEGYNRALQQVDAEYVILLNSDVEVAKDWLSILINYMDCHPEVAACQPKILSEQNKLQFEYAGASGGFIDKYGYPFCRGRIFDTVEVDYGLYDEACSVFWASGAALMIRLEVYRKVGGLDARFFAHMEEIDLCWRIKSRGYQIACVPESEVYHFGGGTLQKSNPRKTFLNFRNNLLMLYKNLPDSELGTVMRVRFFLDYLAVLVFLVKGEWKNAGAVCRARREYRKLSGQFKLDRLENLDKSVLKSIPERWNCSILWQYHAKRKRIFALLEAGKK